MSKLSRMLLAGAALCAAVAVPFASDVSAAEKGVKAGYLRCDVAGSVSFIFGSSRDITCSYETEGTHRVDNYTGEIKKYGIDIGYQKKGVMIWAVVAPPAPTASSAPSNEVHRDAYGELGPGTLAGDYAGITADLAAGYGVGANALLGGYKDLIVLQPLSVEGIQGVNIAAGVVGLTLKAQ
jgi:hypothetical protein